MKRIFAVLLFLLSVTVFAQEDDIKYLVKRGETFESIAKANSVYVEDLRAVNSRVTKLYTGTTIVIPLSIKNKFLEENRAAEYGKFFDRGNTYYNDSQYKKAIENYMYALNYKVSGEAYYNIALSYYNLNKFRRSAEYCDYCMAKTQLSTNLYDQAYELKTSCIDRIEHRQINILSGVAGALMVAAAVGTAIMSYDDASFTPAYTSYSSGSLGYIQPSMSNVPSYSFWNYDPAKYWNQTEAFVASMGAPHNEAEMREQLNQLMQFSYIQSNYQMQEMQAFTQELIEMTAQQVMAQNQAEYAEFSKYYPDISYDEWYLMKAQACMNSVSSDNSFSIDDSSYLSSESNESSSYNTSTIKVDFTCPVCDGKGKKRVYVTAPNFGLDDYPEICDECNEVNHPSTRHAHVFCSMCGGTGRMK